MLEGAVKSLWPDSAQIAGVTMPRGGIVEQHHFKGPFSRQASVLRANAPWLNGTQARLE